MLIDVILFLATMIMIVNLKTMLIDVMIFLATTIVNLKTETVPINTDYFNWETLHRLDSLQACIILVRSTDFGCQVGRKSSELDDLRSSS